LLHIHGRKALITSIIFCGGVAAHAQMNVYTHDQQYNSRLFHFGISIGFSDNSYKVAVDSQFMAQQGILAFHTLHAPGFSLGILSDLHLSKSFEFRFIPDLSFGDRAITYQIAGADTPAIKRIQSVYLDLPIDIKYRSVPYKDMRVYVVAGAKYSMDMQSNATARRAQDLIKVYKNDIALEYGVGMEFHLPLVIISPEIKASYGLFDVLKPDPNLNYSYVLKSLHLRSILFAIHFEG
jgi:Outer membrane protein beta-barrel domain